MSKITDALNMAEGALSVGNEALAIRILITDRAGKTLDLHTITRPATVDNFEGISALPRADGSVRFYLISDDNFSPAQRTLLLAFDWTPGGTSRP